MNPKRALSILALLLSSNLLAADFSGKYSGTLNVGDGRTEPLFLMLAQQGSSLRGSLGPDAKRLHRFDGGSFTEDSAQFKFGQLTVTLRLNGEAIRQGRTTPDGKLSATRVADLTMEDRLARLEFEGEDRSPRILALRDAFARGEGDVIATPAMYS